MKYKSIIILALTIFVLITIAGVSAADTNNTAIASEDTGEIELSASDDISVNNLETNVAKYISNNPIILTKMREKSICNRNL